jgi:molybdenum cofactor cytidylyltransferase
MSGFNLGVVLLAAGASSRMGRPKLLLPWGDITVLEHLLCQWASLGAAQVGIVCAAANAELERALDMLKFPRESRIVNPTPELGMFSSIRCAAEWNGWAPSVTHWAITLGDQPQVQLSTLKSVAAFAAEHPENISQPSRNGRPRHPVILPRRWFLELRDAAETDLKQFLSARQTHRRLMAVDDAGLDLDVDSPEDYERAKQMFANRRTAWR